MTLDPGSVPVSTRRPVSRRPAPNGVQRRTESRRAARPVTVEQWLAIPEEQRAELIDGGLVYQAFPGARHGRTQWKLAGRIGAFYDPDAEDDDKVKDGQAWWISAEVDMLIGGCGVRPDVLGWRRARVPELPEPDKRGVCTVVPDFICEVLSKSTAHIDQGAKRLAYHRAGVTHYWIADPENATLTVLERTDRGYVIVLVAGADEVVSAPPFEAVSIRVASLFATTAAPRSAGSKTKVAAARTAPRMTKRLDSKRRAAK